MCKLNYSTLSYISLIQCMFCALVIWHLQKDENLQNSEIINTTHINSNLQNQCNIDFDTVIKFGAFYGMPLYYKKKGSLPEQIKLEATLSIATMIDISHFSFAKQIALNFNGPTSISIYIESLESEGQTQTICNNVKEYFNNMNNRYDISISIMFPDYTSDYYNSLNLTGNNVPLHAKIPINSLRNMAVFNVYTKYVTVWDVDFIFMSNTINSINNHKYDNLLLDKKNNNKIWVIPSFIWNSNFVEQKYKDGNRYVFNKAELLQLIKTNNVTAICLDFLPAHICTNYDTYFNTSDNYQIDYCNHHYEPYIILGTQYAKNKYKWDDSFIGRGGDKVQHIAHLAYDCFEFEVMADMFIIHDYHRGKFLYDSFQQVMCTKYFKHFVETYCDYGKKNLCWTNDICDNFFQDGKIDISFVKSLQFEQLKDTMSIESIQIVKNIMNSRLTKYIRTFYTDIVTINVLKILNDSILKDQFQIRSESKRLKLLRVIKELP